MHVDTAVKEVDEAVAKEVGGEHEAFRESVRAAFEAVDEAAGGDAVADLTRFVAGYVRDESERPDPTAVDARAADIVREHGEDVPTDSHLRNA